MTVLLIVVALTALSIVGYLADEASAQERREAKQRHRQLMREIARHDKEQPS